MLGSTSGTGLLIDTNILVLYVIGLVNRSRIETFKRTRQYTVADFELLKSVLEKWKSLHTIAHVLAEVNNLTDLTGPERQLARYTLKEIISSLTEAKISSAKAAENPVYQDLGLVDAAIATIAREHRCTVLTDDLDLYLMLERQQIEVLNFTHPRARSFGL